MGSMRMPSSVIPASSHVTTVQSSTPVAFFASRKCLVKD